MGAINYGSNKDFDLDIGFNLKQFETEDSDCYDDYSYECFERVQHAINRQGFNYYKIELKGGYYEGFYLSISFKFLWLEDSKEKTMALKEATRLRKLLIECVKDYDCVKYHASWVSTYYNAEETIKAINQTIKSEKQRIKALYTEKTLTNEKWRELVGLAQ